MQEAHPEALDLGYIGSRIRLVSSLTPDDVTERLPNAIVLGEPGTGKDWAAKQLHLRGPHRDGPFVHIDCRSLARRKEQSDPRELVRRARGGTLFLDHVEDMPSELQGSLLHEMVCQSSARGPNATRFLAASACPVETLLGDRQLQDELFLRLAEIAIIVPPLRVFRADIPQMAARLAREYAHRIGRPPPRLTKRALGLLAAHGWPGNLREFADAIERAVLQNPGGKINDIFLSPAAAAPAKSKTRRRGRPKQNYTLLHVERSHIKKILRETGGNISEAARRLGIGRGSLRYRISKLGMTVPNRMQ